MRCTLSDIAGLTMPQLDLEEARPSMVASPLLELRGLRVFADSLRPDFGTAVTLLTHAVRLDFAYLHAS